jgi:hypothetical protein
MQETSENSKTTEYNLNLLFEEKFIKYGWNDARIAEIRTTSSNWMIIKQ